MWDSHSLFFLIRITLAQSLPISFQLHTNVPTITHLNLKNDFNNNVKRLYKVANKQMCRLQLVPLHSGYYSDLTRVSYNIELYLRHKTHTHTLS
jgi:hypothetical protein